MSKMNRLDIIIFGASGFTGKRMIPELTKLLNLEKVTLRWGVAGRSESKLKSALLEMQEETDEDYSNIPIIIANVNDVKSLEEMTVKARVIINTVGPYNLYGELVVEACIKTGTHLIDICGVSYVETEYFDKIQLKYDLIARQKGIYIISGCALDDMPADLGMIFLQRNLKGTLKSLDTYLYYSEENNYPGAIVHYTTYESLIRGYVRNMTFREFISVLSLRRPGLFKSRVVKKWCILFPGTNYSILKKTRQYMYEVNQQNQVVITNYLGCAHFLQFLAVILLFPAIVLMSKCECTRNFLLKHSTFLTVGQVSHEGPSKERLENTHFYMVLVGKGSTEETLVAQVSSRSGYRATCSMATLSAITVLIEDNNMPKNGGCYSPGAAFGNTSIIEKLKKCGVNFELNPEFKS